MWLLGLAVIAGYYLVPAIHQIFEQVAELKTRWGIGFSAISTGLFGGMIPSIMQAVINKSHPGGQHPHMVSNSIFWAFKGVEIDLFYQIQARLIGDESSVLIVAIKTLVDQFLYVPVFGLVNVVLFIVWRDCGYDFRLFRKTLGRHWYSEQILPVLIANWMIWIPAVILIYCFPLALQLPIQNLILCFWILLLTLLTSRSETGWARSK